MSRWMANRAGLINFWYYDDEEFSFAQGKLLLRGSNGSGKSVTMQSLVPLILDGNKSPERLDPFGSRARRMEDYLLGEGERSHDERTGYLFLEFKQEEFDQYRTVGIGLKARRHKPLDFWGFVILDGRRIGRDFFLYQEGVSGNAQSARIPLTKRELKELIGDGGTVVESQRDYMSLVNQHIFGFQTIEEYDDLIKLLIQLRSPKLSKDFKPSLIYEIMNSSLPALSDDELRPLTEAIENMDQIQLQLDRLGRNQRAAQRITREYDRYNQFILLEKTQEYKEKQNEHRQLVKQITHLKETIESEKDVLVQVTSELANLESEEAALKEKETQLRKGDAFQLEEKYLAALKQQEEIQFNLRCKEEALANKQTKERMIRDEVKQSENQLYLLDKEIAELLASLADQADEIRFHDHQYNQSDLAKAGNEDFDFTPWKRDLAIYQEKVKLGVAALQDQAEQERRYEQLLTEQDEITAYQRQAVKREEQCYRMVDEGRQQFLTLLHDWSKHNQQLLLTTEEKAAITKLVLGYGEGVAEGEVRSLLVKAAHQREQTIIRNILKLTQQKEIEQAAVGGLQTELAQWENSPEAEPVRAEHVTRSRVALGLTSCPHIPLYSAVEFRDGLDEGTKASIEAALADLGILDALLIPQKFEKHMEEHLTNHTDKYLVRKAAPSQHGRTLADYLEPSTAHLQVPHSEISGILQSFSLDKDNGDVYITDHGQYGLGLVKGKTCGEQPARFIGMEARRRYRKQIMDRLRAEIAEHELLVKKIESDIKQAESAQERLGWEIEAFPQFEDLQQALNHWQAAVRDLNYLNQKQESHGKRVNEQLELVNKAKAVVHQKTRGLDLAPKLSAYSRALEGISDYREDLLHLTGSYAKLSRETRLKISLQERLEELGQDVITLQGETNVLEVELGKCQRQLAELDSLRNRPEVQEVKAEIAEVVRRLSQVPKERARAAEEKGRLNQLLCNLSDRLTSQEQILKSTEVSVKHYRQALLAELKLGFIWQASEEELDNQVSNIIKELEPKIARTWDRETLGQQLQNVIYEHKSDLVDFGITVNYLFSREQEELTGSDLKVRRYQITAKLDGQQVSIYQLVEWLAKEIELYQQLLQETDRRLFEEIIMQTVGQKIRAKIYRAEQWVKNINKLMSKRDTSSGLTFYLQWRPNAALSEEEMDTRELVDILKMNTSLVREDKFQRVTDHFRSRVQKAKQRLDNHEQRETFHQIVRDVLDYRNWFEFQLHYEKAGESRKPLTNRAFDRLSGGEKAMAMYIPLFSSVYSRYQSAQVDAPRLISLDEAFAGVDETNIRDMFSLMEQLEFNYLINSQILWGDYDTVGQLAICELIRPKNADFVSVMRFYWDGSQRHLLINRGLMEDESSEERGNGVLQKSARL